MFVVCYKIQWPQAVDMYREAMRSWTEHEATFRTDALQVVQEIHQIPIQVESPKITSSLRRMACPSEISGKFKDTFVFAVLLSMIRKLYPIRYFADYLEDAERHNTYFANCNPAGPNLFSPPLHFLHTFRTVFY